MTTTYERYLKLNIDSSRIGLERGESESNYFCTPKGAKVIGWASVDGIHYCFVRGFGEMVFAISPMNTPGNYVHPVARDFMDFLRLLLTCGDAAALEQVYCWDQAQFDNFLQDNAFTAEQQAVLDAIREKLLLAPMKQPFSYIKELQTEFDYSRVNYKEDYYEWVPVEPKIPEWKVYFDGDFWGHHGRERAGKEIFLDELFVWHDEVWHIPAIYTCSKGLVVDFCVQVPAERIRSFRELERRGYRFVRYADDMLIFCKSKRAAKRTLEKLIPYIERKLFLKVNREKTEVAYIGKVEFLGYAFYINKNKEASIRVHPKSVAKMKARIREITTRSNGMGYEQRKIKLKQFIVGWVNYFKLADMKTLLKETDKWLRRRTRMVIWKQWKGVRTRYAKLRQLGIVD